MKHSFFTRYARPLLSCLFISGIWLVPSLFGQDELPLVSVDGEGSAVIPSEKIVIAEGLSGMVYVVYDAEANGDEICCPTCESDYQGHILTIIPPSGIYRYHCSSQIHETALSEGKLLFFRGIYRGPYFNRTEPALGYQYQEYLALQEAIKKPESTIDLLFDPTAVVVVPLGFDLRFKKEVEAQLGHSVIGRVAAFRVGRVQEILQLSDEDLMRMGY